METLVLAGWLLVLCAQTDGPAGEARRRLELGDYPGAERALDAALATLPGSARDERALRLVQRAEARALQGILPGAVEDVDAALRLSTADAVRGGAASVLVRARRYAEARPHLDALLGAGAGDARLRFLRGIVRGRTGSFEAALADLETGLSLDGAGREARFELALALGRLGRPDEALTRLREILEDDPYDADACYQASRQLLATRRPPAVRQAGYLVQYFQLLRDQEGASSRDQHLAFAGEAAGAALERARRHERLGRFDRALAEAARAGALGAGEGARDFVGELWARQGFPGGAPATAALAAALGDARRRGDLPRAGRLARLLVALDPRSREALEQLVAETAADPALLAPRLHFQKRLAALDPGDARAAAELVRLRAELSGGAPPR